MVQAQVDGDRLSLDEPVTMVVNLVFAGRRATTHLIGNAVAPCSGIRPARRAASRAGRPAAVNELMRLWSPIQVARPRCATEDVEVGGVVIRAGDAVVPALAANTDPRRHADGDRLDLGRRQPGR